MEEIKVGKLYLNSLGHYLCVTSITKDYVYYYSLSTPHINRHGSHEWANRWLRPYQK